MQVIDLDDLELVVVLPKKVTKINEKSIPSRRRKTKETTTELESKNEITTENTTEKSAGTAEALEITVG